MENIQLNAKARTAVGGNLKKLRKQGMTPAVLYGHHVENTPLTVNTGEFEKVLKKAGESTIVQLATDDGKAHPVIIQDVQYDALNSRAIHADFYEVNMSEKLTATVPLEFAGESKAVKELGGVLLKVLSEVEVECLPADLPHSITVDIAALKDFDNEITVKNLKVSSKVAILTEANEIIAKVQPPRDVEAELAAPVVEDVSAVQGAAEEKPQTEEPAEEAKAE